MKRILLFALLMSVQVNATQVYKYTVNSVITFIDQPCSADTRIVKVQSGKSNNTATPCQLVNQYLKQVKQTRSCKAPESVKVVNHFMRWKQDDSGARQLLVLEVKAKNGYGAYDGTTFSECFLDHNGTGLSTVQHFVRK
ncbi:DUF4124 domain-containing protein [Pseudoalteromonas sp. TAB23]|uniref:DUF4124 domain-containing protein n=1 Tax=Pseudoalteromonas sp. TAB23 TaxID=1938595 RepID=UPI00040B7341|nr:DUF4124 domain-containing protein [Pseudoalteromonas sp. TAB23]